MSNSTLNNTGLTVTDTNGNTTISLIGTSGDIRCASVSYSSDRQLKDNIVYLNNEDALRKISELKPCTFVMKNTPETIHSGVIAQEIQDVFPDLVNKREDETLAVHYTGIIAYLVSANQALLARIEALEDRT